MRNSTKTYPCKNCGTETRRTAQKLNIFCSTKCCGENKLKETTQRFLLGQVSERITLRRLLAESIGYACSVCNISEHNNLPITLQVDHRDGNAANNMPDNLRLICPNCHSQSATFGGRNKGNGRAARGLPLR